MVKGNYSNYLESAVELVKSKGYEAIKAKLPEYESPSKLVHTDTEDALQPDLTAKSTLGKHYFEIVYNKSADKVKTVGKWKLFSKLAQLKNGKFFLLVPHGRMSYTKKLLSKYNIKADVMKLQLA